MCDLLWSDPIDTKSLNARSVSPRKMPQTSGHLPEGWSHSDRGVSYKFTEKVVHDFCERHDIDLVCRAHQVVEEGYEFFADRRCVTVFSAPNYCGQFDNDSAIMSVDEELCCKFIRFQLSKSY